MKELRLPLQPLMEAVEAGSVAELVPRMRVSAPTVYRWFRRGIPWGDADGAAVAVGFHPASVWPEWLDYSIALNRELCEAPSITRYTRGRCRCPGCRDEASQAQRESRLRRLKGRAS